MNEYQHIAKLTDEEMRKKKPHRELSERRMMVWYMCYANRIRVSNLCREYGFSRNTIEYAIKRCSDLYETDKEFKETFDRIFLVKPNNE